MSYKCDRFELRFCRYNGCRWQLAHNLHCCKRHDENRSDKIADCGCEKQSGGLVDEAVKIMGYFVPKGTSIVSTKGRDSKSIALIRHLPTLVFPEMKLAVMVNRGSASPSEILAGAPGSRPWNCNRGAYIRQRTGTEHSTGWLWWKYKVTMAKYYTPSGRCVQALDYSHRNEDGSVGRIPDSLTTAF